MGVKEISVGNTRMARRCAAPRTSQHHLIYYKFSIVFADGTGHVAAALNHLSVADSERGDMLGFIESPKDDIVEVHASRHFERGTARELYDVGVGHLPVPAQNVESQYLGSTSLHVVLPKNHIYADKTHLTSQDLLHQSYIALHPRSMLRKAVDENLNKSNVVLVPQHEMSSPALACQLVREGLGFTIVDPLWIDYEQRDKYCFVPLKPKKSIDFGIFTNKSSPPSKAKDEFIDCLKDISTEVLSELK